MARVNAPNSTECQICEDVIQSLDTVLTDPSDQKEILDDLSSVVCTPLGPFKDDCPVDLAGSLSFAGGGGGILFCAVVMMIRFTSFPCLACAVSCARHLCSSLP